MLDEKTLHCRLKALLHTGLAASLIYALAGCGDGILSPAGPVAEGERIILLDAVAIMLLVGIPAMIGTLAFAWWFRAGNARATRREDWSYSGRVELLVWSVPALIVLFLGGIAWVSSHKLDPARPLSTTPPLEVEVVSLDWKWLFIYPAQGIASVNRLVLPAGAPVHLRLTSATVMNVFFVPRIASEIYTMNGMETQLYVEASNPGAYHGLSAHFSGDGFANMDFTLDAVAPARFGAWVNEVRAGAGAPLDDAGYRALLMQKSERAPYTYPSLRPGLFDAIVRQTLPPGAGPAMSKERQ